MDDELVHVSGLLSKSGHAIAANFGRAKIDLEQRVVASTNYREVVRHLIVERWSKWQCG